MKKDNLKLIIGWLYPDLMSTYGDRGNIICLEKRCQWRGIEVEVKKISIENSPDDLVLCDLLFMGGAQDRQQKIASSDLKQKKGPLIKRMIDNGIPALFICGAYQFMGHYYKPAEGDIISGLGIFDLHTISPGAESKRLIGNIIIKCHFSQENLLKASMLNDKSILNTTMVGFENHGGRTYLGKGVRPLGEVVIGYGNNGEDRTEGCIYKNAIGSYLHGPILPKNPHLADWLIGKALLKKDGKEVELQVLDDNLEWQAHETIASKILR